MILHVVLLSFISIWSSSVKSSIEIFMITSLNLYINLGCIHIFTIFSLSIHEHRINLFAFLRSCFMFCNKMFHNFLLNSFTFLLDIFLGVQYSQVFHFFFPLGMYFVENTFYNWLFWYIDKLLSFIY